MRFLPIFCVVALFIESTSAQQPWPDLKPWNSGEPLKGTQPLDWDGDISLKLVEMNDRFLDRQIEKAVKIRVGGTREKLADILGVNRDKRVEKPEVAFFPEQKTAKWRAFDDVNGYGLLLEPKGEPVADVIFVPDADEDTFPNAVALQSAGFRVLVVRTISRQQHPKYPMSTREWLHRPAFELGRTLAGYEIQKILAAADWFSDGERPLGIMGRGEGGMLALFSGALDERFVSVAVGGYAGPHELLWQEPADRNIFGIVQHFGMEELSALVEPRKLLMTHHGSPVYSYRSLDLQKSRAKLPGKPGVLTALPGTGSLEIWLADFARSLGNRSYTAYKTYELQFPEGFAARQVEEIRKHNQWVMHHAASERKLYWKDLDTRSLEAFQKTVEPYREKFRTEVIGDFEEPFLPFNARTRPYQQGPKTQSYEVVLDVMDGVIAYGILTLPKDLPAGEKRPVVVCQHGLEGTPQDVIGEQKYKAYKSFATRLAEEGFITFAPQNGYKYFDLFRMQQFKAQSIGKTLFSIIVPQHKQITEWLATLPFVESEKIGFYGLSYGGKSAMRIPPLVDRYCLSICSADFNDWVWKNAATDPDSLRYSYANKGEYEIFEWNLGGTFNYAEMANLIAPRPFMVERGHFDGVAPDDRVALEFAKIRYLYQAKLGIGDRCEIEWFVGPHSINAEGTYQFLKKHLGLKE